MIEITLTGTGSPMVDPNRAGPSTLVVAGEQTFLVDCGRGVLMRAAAVGVGAANLTATKFFADFWHQRFCWVSRNSHALAKAQCRFAVREETLRARAACSVVKPPK